MRILKHVALTIGLVLGLYGFLQTENPARATLSSGPDETTFFFRGECGQPGTYALVAPGRESVEVLNTILLCEIAEIERVRLGLSNLENETLHDRYERLLVLIMQIESSGKRYAQPPVDPQTGKRASSAKSFYQFVDGSIGVAVNRLERYMKAYALGSLPQCAANLRRHPSLIFETSERCQAILTLVNIIGQRGSDELLYEYLRGNDRAAMKVYYAFHHTNPDGPTIVRTEQLFEQYFN